MFWIILDVAPFLIQTTITLEKTACLSLGDSRVWVWRFGLPSFKFSKSARNIGPRKHLLWYGPKIELEKTACLRLVGFRVLGFAACPTFLQVLKTCSLLGDFRFGTDFVETL